MSIDPSAPVLSLRPINERAKEVVAHPLNSHLVSNMTDGTPSLDIRFGKSRFPSTLAILGRGMNVDIFVDGIDISRVHCTFEMVRESNMIMLCDESTHRKTYVFGENSTPFKCPRYREVIVRKGLNTKMGMGGTGEGNIQFEIMWHFSPEEVALQVKNFFDAAQENEWEARTIYDLEDVCPSYSRDKLLAADGGHPEGSEVTAPGPHDLVGFQCSCGLSDDLVCCGPKLYPQHSRDASRPYHQFYAQLKQEKDRILGEINSGVTLIPPELSVRELAYDGVKKEWMEQGIWCRSWKQIPGESWMHEALSFRSSALEDGTNIPQRQNEFVDNAPSPVGEPIQAPPASDIPHITNVEASRPFDQFAYQMSKERQRIQGLPGIAYGPASAESNTRVYEKVKAAWENRSIWNEEWGKFPGMTWIHEDPVQGLDAPHPQSSPEQTIAEGTTPVARCGVFGGDSPPQLFCPAVPTAQEDCNVGSDKSSLQGVWERKWRFRDQKSTGLSTQAKVLAKWFQPTRLFAARYASQRGRRRRGMGLKKALRLLNRIYG